MGSLNDKQIADRLKEIKADKKFKSSRAFALAINADPSFFNKILKGEKSITETYVLELAKKWAVSENWLLHGNGAKYGAEGPHTDLETALIDLKSWQARVDATLTAIISEIIPILSKANGKSNASVFSQLQKDIDEGTENRMASIKKKQ